MTYWGLSRTLLLVFVLAALSSGLHAQSVLENADNPQMPNEKRGVRAALGALGFAVLPSPFGASLSLESTTRSDLSFYTGQVGGGYSPQRYAPLYFEGFVAAQEYSPSFILQLEEQDVEVPLRWRAYAATGGVGTTFVLAENVTFRPIANVALARFSDESSLLDAGPGTLIELLTGEGLWAGGYGASALLEYRTRSAKSEVDLVARYSWMRLLPLGDLSDIDVHSSVSALAGFARRRVPVESWRAFGNPVRFVADASYTAYLGDQGDLLGLPWLGRAGFGLEVESATKAWYVPDRGRVMLRYVFSEDYGALNLGLGVSF